MVEHRAFLIDGARHISNVTYISKGTDAAALDEARGLLVASWDMAIEVWDLKRLVGRIERQPS